MSQLRVFLSHSSQDKSIADAVVQGLRAAGADVWYDEQNLGAGLLMNEIQRELDRRPMFIVLLSKAAFASSWVKRETDWAFELADRDPTRLILPVTVEPIERSDFGGVAGWLFLHAYWRIEAPGYQPYPVGEAIARTLRLLELTPQEDPQEEQALPSQPQLQVAAADLLARGKALVAQKRYAKALSLLEGVTQLAPGSFDAWANLGLAYNETGQHGPDLDAYDRALALDAQQSSVWSYKGNALSDLKRYDEALAAYERSLTLHPDSVGGWTGKAAALRGLGRTGEAKTAERRAKALGG